MPSFMELLSKSELSVFEDIIECPRCLAAENVCDSHAEDIKKILINNAKKEIDTLTAKEISK